MYELLHPWLRQGLLTSTDAKWHKHRKMITPSFHFKILQDFHDIMNVNSLKFMEKLDIASRGDTIFDVQNMVHYVTMDIICETAMGVKTKSIDNNDAELVKAFLDLCVNINTRLFDPIKAKHKYYKFFPEFSSYIKNLNIVKDFTYDIIKKRIEERKNEENSEKTNDDDEFSRKKLAFLDTLLSATIDDRPLTLDEIYDEVATFIFAGHDTTTSGVSFAIYLLSRHKEVQERVYEEQKQFLGSNLKQEATFQDIPQMQFLDLVIKEAGRSKTD